ncbi:hypothetical protein [Pectinatus haikarae]|uniref:Uncharacterized protein n=1 Tax=Pectinatus haikarae TaxID=349096 RepID=A0ABT9YAU3_9FIRM|nr:hypothetical protein [Pectinatus haikarae]MDQ0204966.1 hypothetical protein [Pectinatus haikarae]
MLFELDDSIKTFFETNANLKPTSPEIKSINHLFETVSNSEHLLTADLDTLIFFQTYKLMNQLTKQVAFYLSEKWYQNYDDQIHTKFLVTMSSEKIQIVDDHIFKVPLNYLGNISKSRLYAENADDANFYINFCNKLHTFCKNYNGLHFNIEPLGTGGSTTATTIKNESTKKVLALFIIDSDKKSLNENNGGTANQALKEYKSLNKEFVANIYVLNVREKENLLTPEQYKLCHWDSKKIIDTLDFFSEYNKICLDKWFYMDIADGIDLKNVKNDKSFYNALNSYLTKNKRTELLAMLKEDNIEKNPTILCGVGKKACTTFSDQILNGSLKTELEKCKQHNGNPKTIKKMEEKCECIEKIYDMFPEKLKDEWKNIFNNIYDFGCCLSEDELVNAQLIE